MKALSKPGRCGASNRTGGSGGRFGPSSSLPPWKTAVSLGTLARHATAPSAGRWCGEARQLSTSPRSFEEEEEMIRDTGKLVFSSLLGNRSPYYAWYTVKCGVVVYVTLSVFVLVAT